MRHITGLLAAAFIVVAVLAAGPASAASLTVTSERLAAERVPVVACDDSVTVSWTTQFNLSLLALIVDDVSLSGVSAACDGQVFQVTLAMLLTNAALGSGIYDDPAGAGGQINPAGGANQSVTFEFSGQLVLPLTVGLKAWSISP